MHDAGEHEGYAAIADLYACVALYRERPDIQFYVDVARETGSPSSKSAAAPAAS